jgi:hypothetical protein
MKASKLQDSILILSTLALSIDEYFNILKKEHEDKSSIIYTAVSSQILIQACSFKEEWKMFLGIQEETERIVKTRKQSENFIKKINQWTDLEKIRNTFIAHSFRDKSDGYSNRLLKPYEQELNIPNQFPDYIMLCGCIHYIHKILAKEFHQEFVALTEKIKNRKVPAIKKGIATKEDALKELNMIIDKLDID